MTKTIGRSIGTPKKAFFFGGFRIGGKLDAVDFYLDVKEDHVVNYTSIKLNVAEERRRDVAEFITRANLGLPLENFELDFSDGQTRYHMTVSAAEIRENYEEALGSLLFTPVARFRRYGDGLLAVMFGFETPEEAVWKAEENIRPQDANVGANGLETRYLRPF